MKRFAMLLILVLLISISLSNSRTVRAQAKQVINVANAAQVKQIALLSGQTQPVFSIAFSSDSKLLASGGIDSSVRLWDVNSGKQTALLQGHEKSVVCVGFTPDGATLLSASYDGSVRRWDVKTAKQIEVQTADPDKSVLGPQVSSLYDAFSPDGTLLAYKEDGAYSISLWNLKTKTPLTLRTEELPTDTYGPVGFSADGKTLATTYAKSDTEGNTILFWTVADVLKHDPLTGSAKPSMSIAGSTDAYYDNALVFSPDASQLATINTNDMTIHLFDLKTGKVAQMLAFHTTTSANADSGIYGLAFSPDGSILAAASHDKTVRLWDVKTGKELAVLAAHNEVATASFSPDGTFLATSNVDGSIELWGVR